MLNSVQFKRCTVSEHSQSFRGEHGMDLVLILLYYLNKSQFYLMVCRLLGKLISWVVFDKTYCKSMYQSKSKIIFNETNPVSYLDSFSF